MQNNELISRYIYAVTRRLPAGIRKDISQELGTVISDMLEERFGQKQWSTQEVRTVLESLGSPAALSRQYCPDAKQSLIGGAHYPQYLLVLKIVLSSVAFGLSLAWVLNLSGEPILWYRAFFKLLGTVTSGLLSAFAFVTLIFALLYHKDVLLEEENVLDHLPPVPKHYSDHPKWETMLGIIGSVLFATVLLAAPQLIAGIFQKGQPPVPLFDAGVLRSLWPVILGISAAGIFKNILRLTGEGTVRSVVYLLLTAVADLLSLVFFYLLLFHEGLLNPAFLSQMQQLFGQDAHRYHALFFNTPRLVFLMICLITAAELIIEVVKLRNKQ